MKKALLLTMALALAGSAGFAQVKLDLGLVAPMGIGRVLDGSSLEMTGEVADLLSSTFFPFPTGSLHLQFPVAPFNFGVGIRSFSFILETIMWPNAFAEVNLGPVTVEGQLGGGTFVLFGLFSTIQAGRVFFPDLSVWWRLGAEENFRIGGGFLGLFLPDQNMNTIPFVIYLGAKVGILFK